MCVESAGEAHLIDGRVVDDALGAAGKAQRGVRLVGVHGRGRDGADDGRLDVAAERGLQDARQLGVAVGDVPACAQAQRGRMLAGSAQSHNPPCQVSLLHVTGMQHAGPPGWNHACEKRAHH